MEESIVTSYNYSGTCIIYWRIKIYICVPRQGTRKKLFKINIFLPSNFPQIWGNYPDFRKILNTFDFSPNLGKYLSFGAKSINSDFIGVIDDSGTPMEGFLTPSLVLGKSLSGNIYTEKFDR